MDHQSHLHSSHSGHSEHAHAAAQGAGRSHGGHDHAAMIVDYRQRFWISLALTFPVLLLSPAIQQALGIEQALTFGGSNLLLFALSSAIYFYGGWPFLKGLMGELRDRQPGMMTLISLAISVAYFYSVAVVFGLSGMVFFWELATLIDIMLLGHWIEMKSVLGASGALKALVELLPATAHRLGSGNAVEDVPVSAVRVGDRVLVKPGERVPTDGLIIEGRTSMNESMLTGESKPVTKDAGQEAIGGAINGEGSIVLEIRKKGDETYLSQVIKMVSEAQESRSRSQDIANRAAQWLTYIALSVGGITFALWILLGQNFAFALERMVTVMVITCPHALGLAVPLVVAVSTSLAAGNGLLIRDRAAFERARNLQAVVFDKTGTLTEGRFGVTDVLPLLESMDENSILRIAATLETQSEHPIATGIVRAAQERNLALGEAKDFVNITGQGAQAMVDGQQVAVVSPGYLQNTSVVVEHPRVNELAQQGKTVVFVTKNGKVLGAIALADIVRPESHAAIAKLKALNIQCMMLTGDSAAVAKTVSEQLGLDDYFAEVLPHQKAEKIRQIKRRGLSVAMVGDGVNDAPALVESDLGIAIGAGTNVAIESADVVLVRSDPRDVAAIMALSRATYKKMAQNLLWATGYNIVAIPLAAGVTFSLGFLMSPAMGAAFMSMSTIIVAINARMLARQKIGPAR
ncbi:MAG: copper-translocating P-type ATPase [Burkholderiales bacterium]